MKKNVISLFLILIFLLLSCHSVKAEIKAESTVKSYKYYHKLLSEEIYPGIEKIVLKYKDKDKDKIEKEILKDIFLFLEPYVLSKKIIINIRQPVIFLSEDIKLEDGSYLTYMILRLEVLDESISDKYVHFGLVFTNSFVIKRTHTKVKI